MVMLLEQELFGGQRLHGQDIQRGRLPDPLRPGLLLHRRAGIFARPLDGTGIPLMGESGSNLREPRT